ncbi:hypothetical protein FHW89_004123 [Mucilaginibacter sp. SG564]|nr:hypothetical protein [Mucilaginibacter sp. SG564]
MLVTTPTLAEKALKCILFLRSFATTDVGKKKKAGGCAIPLLRGVEGCVFLLDEHTPAIAQSRAPPLKRGIFVHAGSPLRETLRLALCREKPLFTYYSCLFSKAANLFP